MRGKKCRPALEWTVQLHGSCHPINTLHISRTACTQAALALGLVKVQASSTESRIFHSLLLITLLTRCILYIHLVRGTGHRPPPNDVWSNGVGCIDGDCETWKVNSKMQFLFKHTKRSVRSHALNSLYE